MASLRTICPYCYYILPTRRHSIAVSVSGASYTLRYHYRNTFLHNYNGTKKKHKDLNRISLKNGYSGEKKRRVDNCYTRRVYAPACQSFLRRRICRGDIVEFSSTCPWSGLASDSLPYVHISKHNSFLRSLLVYVRALSTTRRMSRSAVSRQSTWNSYGRRDVLRSFLWNGRTRPKPRAVTLHRHSGVASGLPEWRMSGQSPPGLHEIAAMVLTSPERKKRRALRRTADRSPRSLDEFGSVFPRMAGCLTAIKQL